MPRQRDLISRGGLHVKPEPGHTEPTLWVRRLVLWSEPGVVIRKILLRPGLNIVWSPDPTDHVATLAATSIGHGSGKTLFCRLLRYCLGEDHFALDDQRFLIANAFPKGLVGAEVRIDGTTWAVRRPIGMGRQHFAIPNGNLEDITSGVNPTGIEAYLEAIENKILSKDVVSLIPGDRPLQAWLLALAWLTRDQECRFDHVLDWRSSASDSGSPARSLSVEKRLDALRALMGAIVPEEYKLRGDAAKLVTGHEEAERQAGHHRWAAQQLRVRLTRELGLREDELPSGRLGIEFLRKAAKAGLARLAAPDSTNEERNLEQLRTMNETAQQLLNNLSKSLAEVEARIPEIEHLLSLIKGEDPAFTFSVHEAENPVCPICEVPIDRALAEGCKLSHKLPDPEQTRIRWQKRHQDFEEESRRLDEHKQRKAHITVEIAIARKQANEIHQHLQAVERARDARDNASYRARRLLDDVDRLDELLAAQEETQARVDDLVRTIEDKRRQIAVYREAQAEFFNRLSRLFDAIIRQIVGLEAEGKVTLDGNGLRLFVEMGGDRSTAAIDSVKVLAFDLAVLCMTIEGATYLPSFLVHDSPREADLGQSLYHRLFHLVRKLEEVGNKPLFQYILTTTTRPPKDFLKEPWLRATLGGTPAEARLLKRDL